MDFKSLIEEKFGIEGIPINKEDMKYIQQLFVTANTAQLTLKEFPELKEQMPITIFDKEEMEHD